MWMELELVVIMATLKPSFDLIKILLQNLTQSDEMCNLTHHDITI